MNREESAYISSNFRHACFRELSIGVVSCQLREGIELQDIRSCAPNTYLCEHEVNILI